MRFPSCRTQAVVLCNAWLATQSKNRNMQCMHAKNTMQAIDSILCVRCIFRVRALRPMRCVRQLENRPLSQFSAYWWRLSFDVQQWVTSCFMICEIRRSMLVRPGYNRQSVRIKQMDASVSEHVCGGLTCRSPGSMLDNQQIYGPWTTFARHTWRLLFSLHERRTSQGYLHDRCF